jgi:hypothetical protein
MHIFFICVNLYTIKSSALSSHELASHGGVDERECLYLFTEESRALHFSRADLGRYRGRPVVGDV